MDKQFVRKWAAAFLAALLLLGVSAGAAYYFLIGGLENKRGSVPLH